MKVNIQISLLLSELQILLPRPRSSHKISNLLKMTRFVSQFRDHDLHTLSEFSAWFPKHPPFSSAFSDTTPPRSQEFQESLNPLIISSFLHVYFPSFLHFIYFLCPTSPSRSQIVEFSPSPLLFSQLTATRRGLRHCVQENSLSLSPRPFSRACKEFARVVHAKSVIASHGCTSPDCLPICSVCQCLHCRWKLPSPLSASGISSYARLKRGIVFVRCFRDSLNDSDEHSVINE